MKPLLPAVKRGNIARDQAARIATKAPTAAGDPQMKDTSRLWAIAFSSPRLREAARSNRRTASTNIVKPHRIRRYRLRLRFPEGVVQA